MKAREWFRFHNTASDPTVAEIHIIDIIGDWVDEMINEYYGMTATVTAKAFVDQLAKLPDAVTTIKVHINSPGGDVFAATNIANALRDQQLSKGRTVDTVIDGLAASAASIIAMAGKTVTIADNGMLMIHDPWTGCVGNSAAMRKTADTLDAIRNTIVATYKWHSSLDDDAIVAMMDDAETWMGADEAIANGFATAKVDGLKAAASIDRHAVAVLKVPEKFKARVDALLKPAEPAPAAPVAAAAADVLARVSAAGLDLAFATALVSAALPLDQVTARIETAKTEKAHASARTSEIRALCATASQGDLAETFIAGGLSVDGVRATLTNITAKLDRVNIDGGLNPETGTAKVKIDPSAVYAARNK
jgi:ATP-dependent protease ClpP protease subunit